MHHYTCTSPFTPTPPFARAQAHYFNWLKKVIGAKGDKADEESWVKMAQNRAHMRGAGFMERGQLLRDASKMADAGHLLRVAHGRADYVCVVRRLFSGFLVCV